MTHTCSVLLYIHILCTIENKSLFTMYEIHVPLSFWFLQIEDLGHIALVLSMFTTFH